MIFGLIGKKLSHSFSKSYFESKFSDLNLPHEYLLFELNDIAEISQIKKLYPKLLGLNVTIPFKTQVIQYLDELDIAAKEIGAVNTILFHNGVSKGFNTDAIGFEKSLMNFYSHKSGKKILVLGNGGSSKAVQYVLRKKGYEFIVVSRINSNECITYSKLNQSLISDCSLIINTTPVGMFPEIGSLLPITSFHYTPEQCYFDLIYNPEKTSTANKLESKDVRIKNGLEMLKLQADASWEIWSEVIA